ncbi:hypothetical protein [Amycolatopsis sp. 195334CR]|uniref:hypothetical protein n=1 Tax=Amycolatopsis sp. 195334CR TaxID=2814588 RepID=UPI001A8D6068|nr:hypothetical protein [Amycolatopsis sp. 195334CR]MBN6038199.1 hypothetical protein [Amycolatopsis sp. 195334CR]
MTTKAQLRKTALTFEEVEEREVDGGLRYSVRGKEFAALTRDGLVRIRLPDEEADKAVAAYPAAERLLHAGRPVGFQAPLADVGGQHLWALVMAAWRHRAPKRLAAKLDAVVASPVRPGSDLPAAIGVPATRALANAGVTTLAQVATRTEAELLALHGVGPKAVRLLAETLAETGRSMKG